jgi:hypothetical protein
MELKRAVRRSETIPLTDAAVAWVQQCAVVKSILTSLPGDPALTFEGRSVEQAREMLERAAERALAPLSTASSS